MKKLLVSLLFAGAMSASASAFAVPSQSVFRAFIPNGPSPDIDVGTWIFDFDASIPGACRYYVEWDNFAVLPLSADLFVDEAKVHGFANCFTNATRPVHTVLTLSPGFVAYGFDKFQQFRGVSGLILGEDGEDAEMNGTITFKATPGIPPSFLTSSFELEKHP